MAGYINSRNNIIAALAVLLALSVVTNVALAGDALSRPIRDPISSRPAPAPGQRASCSRRWAMPPMKGTGSESPRCPFPCSSIRLAVAAQFLLKSNERSEFLAQRVLEELDVAGRAEVEPESLVSGEFLGAESLVSLKELRDLLHVIVVEVILRDLGRVETG